jgi:predicted helicase
MNLKIDKIIRRCHSWDDFVTACGQQPTTQAKGDLFERLTQLYLQSHPEYRTKLKSVWRLAEVPIKVSKKINLPKLDEGIDPIP